MSGLPSVASARALASAAMANQRLGHENLGFLSVEQGFLPVTPPRQALPASHAPWDQLAADLPALIRGLTLRRAVDELPVLPAEVEDLPDQALLRAATVLGVFAHAYHYVSVARPPRLPASLAAPWRDVRRRLGRSQPVLSYIDLIVYNWRLVDASAPDPMRVANLRLLVPTVDNAAEQVFYLTQTEILARCAPIVSAVARAQQAVADDNPVLLEHHLSVIRDVLREVVRSSLPTIDPNPRSATYVDPVVWAKTVAPLAVPTQPGLLGPSGTSSPIFNLLDAFLRRPLHASQLGREIRQHRSSYPPHWRQFLAGVDAVSVPAYVARRQNGSLEALLNDTMSAYAGPGGFLDRHRRKVFGYLEMAFKVGRSVTIGGFSGAFVDRTWQEVDTELQRSRLERAAAAAADHPAVPCRPGPQAAAAGPTRRSRTAVAPAADRGDIQVSDLVLHNEDDPGYWVAIDGCVLDVTRLRRGHPGGPAALDLHAGTDATAPYWRVHSGSTAAERLRDALVIGRLAGPPGVTGPGTATSADVRRLYDTWVRTLYLAVEMENALRYDHRLLRSATTRGEQPLTVTPYKLERAVETQQRFLASCVHPILGRAEEVWRLAAGERPGIACWLHGRLRDAWATDQGHLAVGVADHLYRDIDASVRTDDVAGLAEVRARCTVLEASSERFLRDMKTLLREGVRLFEEVTGRIRLAAIRDGLLSTLVVLPDCTSTLLADLAAVRA